MEKSILKILLNIIIIYNIGSLLRLDYTVPPHLN